MDVVSPYGKPVDEELRNVYGLDGPEAAGEFIRRHVARHYGLQDAIVERLVVAFGLTAKITTQGECFYLKFTSRQIHRSPEQLFPWLDFARSRDVPVPEVLRSTNGDWFLSPLSDSSYDVVYLMREVPGAPMPEPGDKQLAEYAAGMAQFHEVGLTYPQPVSGRSATWNGKLKHRQRLWQQAAEQPFLSSVLLSRAKGVVEATGEQDLSTTIVHGDFRLCHVFFEEGNLSGLIDVDMSTTGERWVDFCAGLLSGNSPERGNLLNFDQLCRTLTHYDQCLPLSDADKSTLSATFAYAAVETLVDLAYSAKAGTTSKHDIQSVEELLNNILESSDMLV